MIVVRDIFRVKFGQAREATDLWRQLLAINHKSGYGKGTPRLLTDLIGPSYYTLILEHTFDSLSEWEQAGNAVKDNTEWRTLYQKIVALTETGHREILRVVG
jgi:hypothetical protein